MVSITTKTAIGDAADQCAVTGDGGGLEIGFNNKWTGRLSLSLTAKRVWPIMDRSSGWPMARAFVVPGSALGEVEKICSGEESVTITQGARHIMFRTGDTVLVCRRLEGDFLAYRSAIPRNNSIKVEVEARALLSSIERVSLIISEKLKSPLRCVFGDGGTGRI